MVLTVARDSLNRYSMPATRPRNGPYENNLDQTNTARFLFGEDEPNFPARHTPDHHFPTLVRRDDQIVSSNSGDFCAFLWFFWLLHPPLSVLFASQPALISFETMPKMKSSTSCLPAGSNCTSPPLALNTLLGHGLLNIIPVSFQPVLHLYCLLLYY